MEILETHKGRRVDGELTICEKHRQLADMLVTGLAVERPDLLSQVLPILNAAYTDGIRLVKALIDRKLDLPKWAQNNVQEAAALRRQRIKMTEELHAAGRRL